MLKNSIITILSVLLIFALFSKKPNVTVENRVENIILKSNVERFSLPIKENYYISSKQGDRAVIKDNSGGSITSGAYHNAIDFACKEGTDIYAAKSGEVISVWPSYYNGEKYKGHPTYGGCIEIKHYDGTRSRYAHLSYTSVKEGSKVLKGDKIGKSGGIKGKRGSGVSTGPHLHFEIILDIEDFLEGKKMLTN